jgi:MFS family permease
VHLLRQPRFALLISGAALNEIGSWASIIAFWGYAAYRFHSGPDQIALISILWVAPGAVFGLLSGGPIDRFGPRAILLGANVWGVVTSLGMAWSSSYGELAAFVFGSGLVGAFGRPAGNSLTPRLVDDADLLAANSMMSMTTNVAIVVGPLVASVTISLWSIKGAFLIDAGTFVVGALSLLPLRVRPLATGVDRQHTSDYLAGAHIVWRTPNLRRALSMATVVFVTWGGSMVMEPLYVRDILHRSSATFGWLQSVFGVGLIVASLTLPRLGDRVVRLRAQGALLLVSAGGVAMYLASGNLAVATAGVGLWGLATGAYIPPFLTLMQRGSPPGTQGRVMALGTTIDNAAQICAIPVAGVAVSLIGIRATALIEVAALLVFGFLGRSWDRGGVDQASSAAPAAGPSSESSAAATAG